MDLDRSLERIVLTLDRVAEITGRIVAWLTLIMVVTTFLVVVMRYAFGFGRIWIRRSPPGRMRCCSCWPRPTP